MLNQVQHDMRVDTPSIINPERHSALDAESRIEVV